jgi:serine/threonine-protein kinase RsbT
VVQERIVGRRLENAIASEPDVMVVRTLVRKLAESIGMDMLATYSVMTAVSELGWNVLRHAGSGTIAVQLVHDESGEPGVEVTAIDSGPGIENVEMALQDSYSTAGTLGCGLPAVRRLMSEVSVESIRGLGTTVRAVRWLGHGALKTLDPPDPTAAIDVTSEKATRRRGRR